MRLSMRLILSAWFLGLMCLVSNAQNLVAPPELRSQISLPKNQPGPTLRVNIEVPNSIVGVGYIPIKIQLTSNVAWTADRNLVIRWSPSSRGHSPAMNAVAADIPITAPQGSRNASVIRYLPKWSAGDLYKVEVLEDGEPIPGYTHDFGQLFTENGIPFTALDEETSIRWLCLSSKTENLSNLNVHTNNESMTFTGAASLGYGYNPNRRNSNGWSPRDSRIDQATIKDAPTSWLHYQGYDGVLTSLKALEEIKQKNPTAQDSLRAWVMSGGTLVVAEAESRQSVQDAIGLSLTETRDRTRRVNGVLKLKQRNLRIQEDRLKTNLSQLVSRRASTYNSAAKGLDKEIAKLQSDVNAFAERYASTDSGALWVAESGAGRIIGLKSSLGRFSNLENEMLAGIFGAERSAICRRGVDPLLGDVRAERWLVPGVAQPPVYTFMGLLGVFVILVGPVAYRKTSKVGRSHLMFAIAPALALLTTLSMFAYGIVSDGFGTQARVRQLTFVDGQSGDCFERIQSTYFAGIRPRKQIKISSDAELFIYANNKGKTWDEVAKQAFKATPVTVTDDASFFDSGIVPSRSQVQFIKQQPRKQFGRLIFNHKPADVATVDSTIDQTLRDVVICDSKGNYWLAEKIDPNQKGVKCVALDKKKSSKKLSTIYNDYKPDSEGRQTGNQQRRDRYQVTSVKAVAVRSAINTASTFSFQDGIMERRLAEKLFLTNTLPNNSFVAVADVSEDALLVEGASLVSSVRYVMGTLP